jgi:phage host-nuclease inhibitor protein Gam
MATPAASSTQPTEQQILEALMKDPKSRRVLQLEAKKKFPDFPIPEIDAAAEIETRFNEQLSPLQDEIKALREQLQSKQSTDSWEGAKDNLRRKYGWNDKTIEAFKADLEN